MRNELLIAALHQHLSDQVLLGLVLSESFASAKGVAGMMSCLELLVPKDRYRTLLDLPLEGEAEKLGETFDQKGIRVVLASSPQYPPSLRGLKKPPPVLYVQGDTSILTTTGFGICGSRKGSDRGVEIAGRFGAEVAKLGLPEVSGYAKGVDTAAHLGALQAGGTTVVVLAEGILHFRVKKTFKDIFEVSKRMVAVSEFPPGRPWSVHGAMQRNGTICGLSDALVVVEAQATGGTLNAGLECLRQGKPLLVVQYDNGNPDNMPKGNARLIKEGGVPVSRNSELVERLRAVRENLSTETSQPAIQLKLKVTS